MSERFWEKQGIYGGVTYTDESINLVIYPQDHAHCKQGASDCSPDEPGVLVASYNLGDDAYSLGNLDPTAQYQVIRSKLEKVHGFPRWYLDDNKIVTEVKTIDWVREPRFAGAFQMFLPGQKKEFLYISSTPEFDNRVFFAGEHSARKNGWMQGALWSGMKAAEDLVYYSVIHKYKK
jgi:monoamine oxidase